MENLLRYLRTRLEFDAEDDLNNRLMDGVSRMILAKHGNNAFRNLFSKEVVHQILEGGAEMGNIPLLRIALKVVSGPLPANLYSKIGKLMKSTTFGEFQLVYAFLLF